MVQGEKNLSTMGIVDQPICPSLLVLQDVVLGDGNRQFGKRRGIEEFPGLAGGGRKLCQGDGIKPVPYVGFSSRREFLLVKVAWLWLPDKVNYSVVHE